MHEQIAIPEDVKTLGAAVRFLREHRQITLRELARRVGISAPFLSDIEHNRRSTDKLRELASALAVEPTVLTAFDGRLSGELKDWIAANRDVSALLEDIRTSGRSIQELRAALLAQK